MSRSTFTMKAGMRLLFVGVPLLVLLGSVASAQEPRSTPMGPVLTEDPLLASLVKEALDKRPELAQAKAPVRAELERVPQMSALPDPALSLGIQNDGFRSIQIGSMQTSYLSVMVSQTLP
ncbi:MAG: hypothetical protein AAB426_03265, partial [Myxococcota bacterium]